MNLSIKNVPEHVVERLRERARLSHRSLQGELLNIIESVARDQRTANVDAVLAEVRALGLRTPDEATAMIRADRDGR